MDSVSYTHLDVYKRQDYVHTGNEFLDIILKDKAAKAREKQIDFSALVDFKGMDFIEPLDLSLIHIWYSPGIGRCR